MIDQREIREVFFVKQGDIGAFNQLINSYIKDDDWIVFPESYNYDHGLFTIMLAKLSKEDSDILDTSKSPVSSLLGDYV